MKIYDETLSQIINNPDLSKGRLETRTRIKAHHPEIPAAPAVTHIEEMKGTTLKHIVVDSPYIPPVPAWDEYELVQVYIPFTREELQEANKPSLDDRLTAVEDALLELMLMKGGPRNV